MSSGALLRSINGGDNLTALAGWNSAPIVALGPLPNASQLSHALGGRSVRDLAAACARKAVVAGLPVHPTLMQQQRPTSDAAAPLGYAAYALDLHNGSTFTQPYVSVDYGLSWTSLFSVDPAPAVALGDAPAVLPAQMAASRQQPGTVFVGTGGRGIFYYNASAEIVRALLACDE